MPRNPPDSRTAAGRSEPDDTTAAASLFVWEDHFLPRVEDVVRIE